MVDAHESAYPKELREREARLIRTRRSFAHSTDVGPIQDAIGIAVSGGGIRSATFALGVFQALAERRFLRSVDYLSTVSGGGYFGGFLCGLFVDRAKATHARGADAEANQWPEVERALRATSPQLRYLRENGRYLAPAGSDDLWLLISVVLRNWLALLFVLASGVGLMFLVLEVATAMATPVVSGWPTAKNVLQDFQRWGAGHDLVLSPWFLLVPLAFVFTVVPASWAYWLAGTGELALDRAGDGAQGGARSWLRRTLERIGHTGKIGTFAMAGVACAFAHALNGDYFFTPVICLAFGAESVSYRSARDKRLIAQIAVGLSFGVMTALFACAYLACGWATEAVRDRLSSRLTAGELSVLGPVIMALMSMIAFGLLRLGLGSAYKAAVEKLQKRIPAVADATIEDEEHFARHGLSVWLMRAIILTAGLLGLALIHSLGQTIYAHSSNDTLKAFLGGVFAAALAVQSAAGKLMALLSNGSSPKRLSLPGSVAAYVGGIGLSLALFVAISTAVLWSIYPKCDAFQTPDGETYEWTSVPAPSSSGWGGAVTIVKPEPRADLRGCIERMQFDEQGWSRVSVLALVLGAISLIVGWSHLFLNSSSQLPLYTARITRTFLGASNPRRTELTGFGASTGGPLQAAPGELTSEKAATQLMPGDDIPVRAYWTDRDRPDSPYRRGAPLHIINSTINETVDGRSRTQQADRKGLGLAIGPGGLSAGVQHHAMLGWDQGDGGDGQLACVAAHGTSRFKVFDYDKTIDVKKEKMALFRGERLTVGSWLGISGAAFSTGIGYRTNLGMSLLAGLTNVRLGYWWRAGVRRTGAVRVIGFFFWTYHYLRRELLSRFPGTANVLWYLSDGGHFENTGAYELIRRRAPYIIVLDGAADPNYELEDLGNLVRKARLDFDVHIEFLEHDAVTQEVGEGARRYVGTLAELARGKWERVDELRAPPSAAGTTKVHRLDSSNTSERSLVHAAIARVCYPATKKCPSFEGKLVFIKPTIVGGEPADIVRYHVEHPSFPQQTTLDQFFDEAQWESYRALGQRIGERLWVSPDGPLKKRPMQPHPRSQP